MYSITFFIHIGICLKQSYVCWGKIVTVNYLTKRSSNLIMTILRQIYKKNGGSKVATPIEAFTTFAWKGVSMCLAI